uniref:Uncharacterized protein n=1 Tax=Ixodes ricinus TaxID=34613 RepID=A0A6B0TYA8_IXORI
MPRSVVPVVRRTCGRVARLLWCGLAICGSLRLNGAISGFPESATARGRFRGRASRAKSMRGVVAASATGFVASTATRCGV